MGVGIGIDPGPARKPGIRIGLDSRNEDRLVLCQRLPLGCWLPVTGVLLLAVYFVGTTTDPWAESIQRFRPGEPEIRL